MTAWPIIFAAESVRAILAGTKVQTRRVIKPQPASLHDVQALQHHTATGEPLFVGRQCPFGQPGQRLWVRETWQPRYGGINSYGHKFINVHYKADGGGEDFISEDLPVDKEVMDFGGKWRSPLFMPRWASRITLEVVGVKVERVQAITEADAKAEGAAWLLVPEDQTQGSTLKLDRHGHRVGFAFIWDAINAKRGHPWSANDWVWAVEFKRVA